jgi:hypothetical protein
MRVAFGALAVVLSLAGAAPANPPATPDVRYVVPPEAEVRCGSSTKPELYPTNRLHRGDAVEVVEELPGDWLKIKPPPGSFSWIDVTFIKEISPNQPNQVITPEDQLVDVYVGSEIQKGRPTVVGAKLRRGTQVRSIGQPLADDPNVPQPRRWMPIEAPEGEFRFIQAGAVTKTKPAVDTVAAARAPTNSAPASSTFVPAAGGAPAAAAGNAITPVPDLQALYARARQAQDANNLREAIDLYRQAATTAQNQGQVQWANQVFAHARALSDRLQVTFAAQSPAAKTPSTDPAQPDPTVRLAPPPGTTPGGGVPDYAAPGAAATLTARGSPAGNLPSSGPGRLRRAGRTVEYQRTYVLEDAQGLPLLYVSPEPGIDLEPYLEHNVELFGHTAYRGDIRAYYMTVARVQPLP